MVLNVCLTLKRDCDVRLIKKVQKSYYILFGKKRIVDWAPSFKYYQCLGSINWKFRADDDYINMKEFGKLLKKHIIRFLIVSCLKMCSKNYRAFDIGQVFRFRYFDIVSIQFDDEIYKFLIK
jgi:hypothetical protein